MLCVEGSLILKLTTGKVYEVETYGENSFIVKVLSNDWLEIKHEVFASRFVEIPEEHLKIKLLKKQSLEEELCRSMRKLSLLKNKLRRHKCLRNLISINVLRDV